MKVFVTRIIADFAIRMMEDAGHEVVMWTEKRSLSPEELIGHGKQADALLSVGGNKINATFLEACKHLKVIALHSVGYDNVDVTTASHLKIPIGNTPGVLSGATADIAFLLLLATSRKAFYQHKKIISGGWDFFEPLADVGIELNGKTLGIYGLGKIGYEMAKRCKGAYDMNIIYHNRGHNETAEQKLGAVRVSFSELLAQSDVLSVHTALTPETAGQFNKEVFRQMKPTSIFINTARGGIHNEPDLVEALRTGEIWGAGLDVTNPEPMQPGNPLLDMPNVSVLPHIGSGTLETRHAMVRIAAENIIAGLEGKQIPYPVNPEIYPL